MICWARDHRVHHKYSETDADPHNAKRGFFFSHMGWMMVKKHAEVVARGREIDISDLKSDPVIAFQHRYVLVMYIDNSQDCWGYSDIGGGVGSRGCQN